ncbi:MAG: hypothetical protein AAF656_03235 [Planctomycetota bacterium]
MASESITRRKAIQVGTGLAVALPVSPLFTASAEAAWPLFLRGLAIFARRGAVRTAVRRGAKPKRGQATARRGANEGIEKAAAAKATRALARSAFRQVLSNENLSLDMQPRGDAEPSGDELHDHYASPWFVCNARSHWKQTEIGGGVLWCDGFVRLAPDGQFVFYTDLNPAEILWVNREFPIHDHLPIPSGPRLAVDDFQNIGVGQLQLDDAFRRAYEAEGFHKKTELAKWKRKTIYVRRFRKANRRSFQLVFGMLLIAPDGTTYEGLIADPGGL